MLHHFRHNPMAVACLAVILSAVLGVGASGQAQITAIFSLVILAVLVLLISAFHFGRRLRPLRKSLLFGIIASVLTLASCYYSCTYRNAYPKSLAHTDVPYRIEGYATEQGSDSAFGSTKVTVTKVNGKDCEFDLLLHRSGIQSPIPYRYFTATVIFENDSTALSRYTADNITVSATATELSMGKKSTKSVAAFFYRLADRIDNRLQNNLNEHAFSLSRALAVSGMHLTVLLAGVLLLLGKLRAKKWLRLLISVCLIVLYTGICGFTPSILRAALMSICLLVANTVGERPTGIRSLLISLGVILLCAPYLVASVSLQLSALATLGILWLFPLFYIKKKKHWARITGIWLFLFSQYCLTLCATVFTLPVMYYHFGSLSLIAPLANMIFVPLTTALLYVLPVFLVSTFLPFLPTLFGYIVEKLCDLVKFASGFAVYCKDLYCHIPITVLTLLALSLLAVPILYRLRVKRYLFISVLAISLSMWTALPFSVMSDSRLTYRYDGRRETLLLCESNTVLLVETGNASGQNAYTALTEASNILNQTGIDALLLTHYHSASTSFTKYLCGKHLSRSPVSTHANHKRRYGNCRCH